LYGVELRVAGEAGVAPQFVDGADDALDVEEVAQVGFLAAGKPGVDAAGHASGGGERAEGGSHVPLGLAPVHIENPLFADGLCCLLEPTRGFDEDAVGLGHEVVGGSVRAELGREADEAPNEFGAGLGLVFCVMVVLWCFLLSG
jgi:hypothetical protein